MKTGDSFQDAQGVAWQLGQLLGRGLWGKSYAVTRESDDAEFVLKCPFGPDDFRGEVGGADQVFAASREAVLEQARLYADGRHAFLPRLEARVSFPDGSAGFILARMADSLERRLTQGMSTQALLDAAASAIKLARQLPGGHHGALHPTNVLYNDRGELFLTDLATPAVRRALPVLLGASPHLAASYPPELGQQADAVTAGADSWSIAMWLWRGAMVGATAPTPPRAGLDKAGQVALRDRVQDRLKAEDANPRFHTRVAERYAVLLARALSRDATPSPPFRFPVLDELLARVDEVGELIRPQVTTVGKVMLDRPATRPWFDTDEVVAFSCTVGCTTGVEGPDEVGVGIAVFDIDRDERLKDLDLQYTVDKHPGSGPGGGRYRFGFRVSGIGPGRFKLRLAFAIRDSGQAPATTETEVNVMPAPGWVPRAEAPAPTALPFTRDAEEPTRPGGPPPGLPEAASLPPPPRSAPPDPPSGVSVTGVTRTSTGVRRPVPRSGAPAAEGSSGPTLVAPDPSAHAPRPIAPGARPPLATPSSSPAMNGPAAVRRVPAVREPPPRPNGSAPIASPTAPVPSSLPPVDDLRPEPVDIPTVPIPIDPAVPPPLGAAPASRPPAPVPAAPAPPAANVAIEEDEPPDEPAWTPRPSWTDEPLPMAARPAAPPPVDDEDDADDDTDEPGLVERVIDQLRNDPYLAVMAVLGSATLLLLVVFLLLRD